MKRKADDRLDRAVEAAKWLLDLRQRSNETFLPLFFDKHRYLVLKGGAGSGKSIFAGDKLLERALTEPGHRFLVCRKVARTLRESCWRQLLGQLRRNYPDEEYRVNRTDMTIAFGNGSEILFAGLDDVEKLKSIYGITGIWIEEASEVLESDFNQLDIRLRDESPYYKQIIITFNPVSILHWLKRRFFDAPNRKVRTHESTYRDNRFLPREAAETLEAFRDIDEYYYRVYALGEWGITGTSVFDAQRVTERLLSLQAPTTVGEFAFEYDGLSITDVKWQPRRDGIATIYAEPREGIPYVIGVDTAGTGSDWNVAQVIDNTNGEQVATMRARKIDEDVFGHQVFALGIYYNTALIAPEVNFSTYLARELERLRYPRQYIRETMDSFTHKLRTSYGWLTTPSNRNRIIAELVGFTRESTELLHDRATLEEMLTFVRDESWRAEAEEGAHDDCILALAIAHAARPQQDYAPPRDNRRKWTEEMIEDYNDAGPAERRRLLELWGPRM